MEQPKPPHIYVKSTNFKQFCEESVKESGNKFSIRADMNNVSFMPNDSNRYRKIIKYLKEKKAE